jgi:hypothetical protein
MPGRCAAYVWRAAGGPNGTALCELHTTAALDGARRAARHITRYVRACVCACGRASVWLPVCLGARVFGCVLEVHRVRAQREFDLVMVSCMSERAHGRLVAEGVADGSDGLCRAVGRPLLSASVRSVHTHARTHAPTHARTHARTLLFFGKHFN